MHTTSNMVRLRFILFLILFSTLGLGASRSERGYQKLVLRLPPEGRIFGVKDKICFFLEDQDIPVACGVIFAIRKDRMFVRIFYQKERIKGKTNYSLAKINPKKKNQKGRGFSFSDKILYEVLYERNLYKYEFGFGVMTGLSYLFPAFQMQIWLGKKWVFGLRSFYANYVSTQAALRAWGAFLHVDYYFSGERYSGFYTELGAAPYIFTEGDSVSSRGGITRPAFSLGLGWRWRHKTSGFNMGLSAGGQYLFQPELVLIEWNNHGLLPLFTFDVGYAF